MRVVPLLGAAAFFCAISAFAADSALPDRFVEVNPNVFRGAQPSPKAFEELKKRGIKTVINLRSGDGRNDEEKKLVESLGLRYVHIPLEGYTAPPREKVRLAIAEMDRAVKEREPVFIHCKLGRDRTGAVIASYRITRDGWSNDKALEEAKQRGMRIHQFKMRRYIRNFKPETIK